MAIQTPPEDFLRRGRAPAGRGSAGSCGACEARLFFGGAAGDFGACLEAGFPAGFGADAFFAGEIHAARKERKGAAQQYSLAIERAPNDSSIALLARSSRSRMFERLDREEEALIDLQFLNESGDESLRLRVRILRLLRKRGPSEHAEQVFEEVISGVREANTVEAWVELCLACGLVSCSVYQDCAK